MRTEPIYRVYSRWPEDGDAWIHPADVRLVRRLVPSVRVFRYEGREGTFLVLTYGKYRVRVLPSLREAIRGDGFDLGDQVEVCSRLGQEPTFRGDDQRHALECALPRHSISPALRNMTLARQYTAEDFARSCTTASRPAGLRHRYRWLLDRV